jgi:DNA-binding CsgD family transcriptional regulator
MTQAALAPPAPVRIAQVCRGRAILRAVRDGSNDASRIPRDLALVEHAERVGGLGSWDWTPATGELRWSDNLFRIYGLEPGAITPSAAFVVERVHPDDLDRFRAMLDARSAGEPCEFEYRFQGDDNVTRVLRTTVAAIDGGSNGDPRRIIGSVQDITEHRALERVVDTRIAVTEALNHWTSLSESGNELLGSLGRAIDSPFGTIWILDGSTFAARLVWSSRCRDLDWLAADTEQWRPGPGSPSIGVAYATRQPVFSLDALASVTRERATALRQSRLRGSVAVPAAYENETLAVLEFLTAQPIHPPNELRRALQGVGHEIGHFLSRRRGELTATTMTPRELEVLQLAAEGHSADAIGARMHVSSSTVKRHFERAYARLGVSDRSAAVGEAVRRGLIR